MFIFVLEENTYENTEYIPLHSISELQNYNVAFGKSQSVVQSQENFFKVLDYNILKLKRQILSGINRI